MEAENAEDSQGELVQKITHLHTEDDPSASAASDPPVTVTACQSTDMPTSSHDSEEKKSPPSSTEGPAVTEPAPALPQIPEAELRRHQEQRTFLRERFLRMLNNIWDVPINIRLYNQKETKAKFACSDVDILHMQVSDLETPLGVMPSALLRTSDVISYSLELPDQTTSW